MKIKKSFVYTVIMALLVCAFSTQALAAESVQVYVTISDGTLAMAQQTVDVTDIDGDGALTINDALYLAHEAKYDGGAAAGYGSATGEYGLSLTKLWGIENGGSYGYCVNNQAATGLADAVKSGDFVSAYVFTDTAAYSDAYCYFDMSTAAVKRGESIELTLLASGYDANWNPTTTAVEGAEITIDGASTGIKTDADGKAVIKLDKAGAAVISAGSASRLLVPPVCTVSVESTGISTVWYIVIGVGVVAAAVIALVATRKK